MTITQADREARFFIDCEFDGHNGPLLSMSLVREDGDSIHIATTEIATDPWVIANVATIMESHKAPKWAIVNLNDVGGVIRSFIGDCKRPVIVADSPVDIGRFCRALSTGADGDWSSADYPLMTFEVHNVDCYPSELDGAVQHNAWWDAMALRHKLVTHREASEAPLNERIAELKGALREKLADAWVAGATAVHNDWMERHPNGSLLDNYPEFGEAANAYALTKINTLLGDG